MSVTGLRARTGAHRRSDCRSRRGLFAALGVMTALRARNLGKGPVGAELAPPGRIALLDFQAARFLMKGEVPPQVGNDHPTSMPTSAYKTKDGYINVAASGEGQWASLQGARARRHASIVGVQGRAKARRESQEAQCGDREDAGREDQRRMDPDHEQGRRSLRPDLQRRRSVLRPAGPASGHRDRGGACEARPFSRAPAGRAPFAHPGDGARADAGDR